MIHNGSWATVWAEPLPAIFKPAIYHNHSFIKNVPSTLRRTNMKIWFLKISEPFIFEVGSTGCERCSGMDLFCGSIFFWTSYSPLIYKKQWNIQCAMKKLKYFKSAKERKLYTLIGNCCREPLWWYRRETCGTRALWSPSVLSFPTEPVVSH